MLLLGTNIETSLNRAMSKGFPILWTNKSAFTLYIYIAARIIPRIVVHARGYLIANYKQVSLLQRHSRRKYPMLRAARMY